MTSRQLVLIIDFNEIGLLVNILYSQIVKHLIRGA